MRSLVAALALLVAVPTFAAKPPPRIGCFVAMHSEGIWALAQRAHEAGSYVYIPFRQRGWLPGVRRRGLHDSNGEVRGVIKATWTSRWGARWLQVETPRGTVWIRLGRIQGIEILAPPAN